MVKQKTMMFRKNREMLQTCIYKHLGTFFFEIPGPRKCEHCASQIMLIILRGRECTINDNHYQNKNSKTSSRVWKTYFLQTILGDKYSAYPRETRRFEYEITYHKLDRKCTNWDTTKIQQLLACSKVYKQYNTNTNKHTYYVLVFGYARTTSKYYD